MGTLTILGGACPTGHTTSQNTVPSAITKNSLDLLSTVSGSADTVAASSGKSSGPFSFINNSADAATTVFGLNSNSVTVNAPAGGVYHGGDDGNNSLVGGTGGATLFGAGETNYLFSNGSVTGSGYNLLNGAAGLNETLIAGSKATNDVFYAGKGTELLESSGTGSQTFYAGTLGQETISGSTVAGASNKFIFDQSASQGGGIDIITNFKIGEGYINPYDSIGGVTIHSFESLSGGTFGTQIDLSNGTTIKLLGVSASSLSASIVGGTKF